MNQKPYRLLLYIGLLFSIISPFLLNSKKTVDIHLHDTYFILSSAHIFLVLSIFSFTTWIVYILTNKILFSNTLTLIHIIISVLTLFHFAFISFIAMDVNLPRGKYQNFEGWKSYGKYSVFTRSISLTIVVFLFGQLTYTINLLARLWKSFIKKNINHEKKK